MILLSRQFETSFKLAFVFNKKCVRKHKRSLNAVCMQMKILFVLLTVVLRAPTNKCKIFITVVLDLFINLPTFLTLKPFLDASCQICRFVRYKMVLSHNQHTRGIVRSKVYNENSSW